MFGQVFGLGFEQDLGNGSGKGLGENKHKELFSNDVIGWFSGFQ